MPFAAVVESNSAETVSTSWGDWEWFTENGKVVDPITGKKTGTAQAMHELFLRAAIQGQTLFAVSSDNGAYDVDGYFYCFR